MIDKKSIEKEVKKIKKFDRSLFEKKLFNEGHSMISGYELVKGTKDFLDTYYKGCFVSRNIDYATRSLYVSLEGYAQFLKIIFVSVFARELIKIGIEDLVDKIVFTISFNTSYLLEEDIEAMQALADNSNFQAVFEDGKVLAIFKYTLSDFSMFNAISSSFVYNTLSRVFFA